MAETVLLMDSDREHGEAIRTYLQRHQYDVTVAGTAQEILTPLEHQKWNILLGNPLIDEEAASVRIADLLKEDARTQLIVFGTRDHVDRAMDLFAMDAVAYLDLPINSKALMLDMARARNHSLKNRKIDRYVQRLTDLHTARNHFLQLFDSVPCFISVQDKNLRITAINNTVSAMTRRLPFVNPDPGSRVPSTDGFFYNAEQFFPVKGFFHCGDGLGDGMFIARQAGNHDDRRIFQFLDLHHLPVKPGSPFPGHLNVQRDQVRQKPAGRFKTLCGIVRHLGIIAIVCEQRRKIVQDIGIIIYD
jgi:DNA-binding response OmpR family regulator